MPDAESPRGKDYTYSRNVLSFGCELEFIVAYVLGDEPDPDADNQDLAPILRVPEHVASNSTHKYIFDHICKTLRDAGLTLQNGNLPLPPDVDDARARAMFGISVKHDDTIHEGDLDKTWNGYRFQGVEINSSASWTSTIAFQELEMIIRVILHNYRIRVNQSCGLQFHIGNGLKPLNTQTVKRVGALLWCLDPVGCHIHPPQRRRGPFSLPIREYSRLASGIQSYSIESNEDFFGNGRIGKPSFGGSAPISSVRPARIRRFASSRLATSRAALGPHEKLEQEYPDGFGDRELETIPAKDVDSALDGVWRCLACAKTDELAALLAVIGGPCWKPNYSFAGYEANQNPAGQDEWTWDIDPNQKLTIEFREAVGSMDAQWVTALGRICAGIVLFALNSSTAEFFAMLMRLTQAQGDFGDPGSAPYDFIGFLDDIGCFAEAELLEARLQDKKQFWFPCRKLHSTSALVQQDSHMRDPPKGWQRGFGNENEQASTSQSIRADDLWPAEDPADTAEAISEENNDTLTDGAQTIAAGFQQEASTGSGGKESTESTHPDLNKSKGLTGEEEETVGRGTDSTKQETEAARVAASEREAREANMRRFPHGYDRIPVSGHGLLCGPRALIASIVAQEPELLYPPPTLDELQDMLNENPLFQDFNETSSYDALKGDQNNLRADQLAGLLQAWGRKKDPNLNLRLGFVRPLQVDYLFPAPDGNQIIIWVFNNNAQSEMEGIYGHYEGLRPRIEPITKFDTVKPTQQQAFGGNVKSYRDAVIGEGVEYKKEEEEEL